MALGLVLGLRPLFVLFLRRRRVTNTCVRQRHATNSPRIGRRTIVASWYLVLAFWTVVCITFIFSFIYIYTQPSCLLYFYFYILKFARALPSAVILEVIVQCRALFRVLWYSLFALQFQFGFCSSLDAACSWLLALVHAHHLYVRFFVLQDTYTFLTFFVTFSFVSQIQQGKVSAVGQSFGDLNVFWECVSVHSTSTFPGSPLGLCTFLPRLQAVQFGFHILLVA